MNKEEIKPRSPLAVRAYGAILLISFIVIYYDSKEKLDRLLKQFHRFGVFFLKHTLEDSSYSYACYDDTCISGDVCPDLQSQVVFLTCIICRLQAIILTFIYGATPVDLLTASMAVKLFSSSYLYKI